MRRGSFDTPTNSKSYVHSKSGFNKFGDEVSHLSYPSVKYHPSGKTNSEIVNNEFINWLAEIIKQYEHAGTKVIMLPPVCIKSHFKVSYNDNIEKALESIKCPYLVSPSSMVLDDSCTFDTGYHVNKEGVKQNTDYIISILKNLEW